jgi:hypothetical protein
MDASVMALALGPREQKQSKQRAIATRALAVLYAERT